MKRATLAALVLATLAFAPMAGAKPDDPPAPPKPKLDLLTETQRGALRREAIELGVRSKRGRRASVEATLVVGGFPSDYELKLGPVSERLRGGAAEVRLELSARQREVLAFGAQACEPATLHATVHAGGSKAQISEGLRRHRRC